VKKGFIRHIAAILLLAVLFLCLKKDNVFRWVQAARNVQQQQKQIENCREQIRTLEERVEALSSNRDTLEKFARENYNFSVPGEDVYIVNK